MIESSVLVIILLKNDDLIREGIKFIKKWLKIHYHIQDRQNSTTLIFLFLLDKQIVLLKNLICCFQVRRLKKYGEKKKKNYIKKLTMVPNLVIFKGEFERIMDKI